VPKTRSVADQLRAHVAKSDRSLYQLAKEAGIHRSALTRFMRGGTLTIESIERLAPVVGLVLVLEEVGSTKKKRS